MEFLLTLVDVQYAEGAGADRRDGGGRTVRSHPEIRIVECEDQSEETAVADWRLNLPKSAEGKQPDSVSLPPGDLCRSGSTSAVGKLLAQTSGLSSVVVYRRGSRASVHSEILDLGCDGDDDD